MREIKPASKEQPDPGRVFYTIRAEDTGKSVIDTEIGPIHVGNFMGRVEKSDVGYRLYRIQNNARDRWFWYLETDWQYKKRTRPKD